MFGIFGDSEEVRGPRGGEEEIKEQTKREERPEGTGTSTVEDEFWIQQL
jgi:hypothetical protein